jgi:hypothetical protein
MIFLHYLTAAFFLRELATLFGRVFAAFENCR